MYYDEKPVWRGPPSNRWFGFQVRDMERVAEYHRITGDERAGRMLNAWVPWAIGNTTVGEEGEFAVPETRADYARFDGPFDSPDGGLYVPEGWTGRMADGGPITSAATFLRIRSFYEEAPAWPRGEACLGGGPVPEFAHHRFWARVDVATAPAAHGELFGDGS